MAADEAGVRPGLTTVDAAYVHRDFARRHPGPASGDKRVPHERRDACFTAGCSAIRTPASRRTLTKGDATAGRAVAHQRSVGGERCGRMPCEGERSAPGAVGPWEPTGRGAWSARWSPT